MLAYIIIDINNLIWAYTLSQTIAFLTHENPRLQIYTIRKIKLKLISISHTTDRLKTVCLWKTFVWPTQYMVMNCGTWYFWIGKSIFVLGIEMLIFTEKQLACFGRGQRYVTVNKQNAFFYYSTYFRTKCSI